MRFHGIIPAITTPFGADESIDHEGLARNVEYVVEAGVHAIVGNGTMGESGSMSRAERGEALATIVGAVAGRVPVIAGIAAQTPAIATDYAADAGRAGVSGVMVVPPLVYRCDDAELYAYFSTSPAPSIFP